MFGKKQKCEACGNKRQVIEQLLIEIGELNAIMQQYKQLLQQTTAELGVIQALAHDALKSIREKDRALKLPENKKSKNEV